MDGTGKPEGRSIGRYVMYDEIGAGGMATVHVGRLLGAGGFARTVAIKRLHEQFAKDPEFASMFLDEARLASRIRHPNVVSTIDVVGLDGELFLVMEYVHGDSLAKLCSLGSNVQRPPLPIAAGIISGVLHGLHAAHDAIGDRGAALQIVHRDVSPQNILVGTDGIPRVLDFGVAKAAWRTHTTRNGQLRGKLRYMAPEQLRGEPVDRRADIFSASVVAWELLTGRRLFSGDDPNVYVGRLLEGQIASPRSLVAELPPSLDEIIMRGLAPKRDDRFATAREMAVSIETATTPATAREIGEWVESVSGAAFETRKARIIEIETFSPNPVTSVSSEVASRVAELQRRGHRAQLPTIPPDEAPEPTPPRVISGPVTPPPAGPEAASPGTARWRTKVPRVALGLALAVLGISIGTLLPRAGVVSESRTPEAPGGPAVAAVSAAASEVTLADVSPPSLISTATALATTADRLSLAAPASNTPKVSRTPSPGRAGPSRPPPISGKSTPCMKQRTDGVVYFEPCSQKSP